MASTTTCPHLRLCLNKSRREFGDLIETLVETWNVLIPCLIANMASMKSSVTDSGIEGHSLFSTSPRMMSNSP